MVGAWVVGPDRLGYEATQPTRESRLGALGKHNANVFTVAGPYINGDSGGPFWHVDTGLAIGIESRVALDGRGTDTGPTVQGALNVLSGDGWDLELVTP